MNKLLCLTLALVCSLSQVLGQLCSGNSDCSAVTGSTCAIPPSCKKGGCVCPQGQYANGGKCVNAPTVKSRVALGGSCTGDSDCGAAASCQSSKCTCLSSYTGLDGTNCGAFSLGATCSGSQACGNTGNGDCSSGKCACSSGYQWATSGDIGNPGGCVSNSATLNVGQGQTCSATAGSWLTGSQALKFCGSGLTCGMCPEGGSLSCFSGSSSVTVAIATLVMAAVCGLVLGRL